MKIWNVSVRSGSSHDNLAVRAESAGAARAKARAAGYVVTEADTYEISTYGVRFCTKELE